MQKGRLNEMGILLSGISGRTGSGGEVAMDLSPDDEEKLFSILSTQKEFF
jgi:hypothetical protein